VSTTGCTDRFTPSGVAAAPTQSSSCTTVVTTPPSAPIQSTDGELLLDRTRRPLRVQFRGETEWQGTRSCTHPDGTISTWTGAVGGPWGGPFGALYKAAYDGITFSGATSQFGVDYAWSLTRLPPAAAASSPAR
jgi:hypothetical protein